MLVLKKNTVHLKQLFFVSVKQCVLYVKTINLKTKKNTLKMKTIQLKD